MLRQHKSNTSMQMSLVFVLSLCSLSAFSEGVKSITFFQTVPDMNTYTVRALGETGLCLGSVSPQHLETGPEEVDGQTIKITYWQTVRLCTLIESSQVFEIRNKKNHHIHALIKWIKAPGMNPIVLMDSDFNPPGLIKVDGSDPNNIKVWVGYNNPDPEPDIFWPVDPSLQD